MQSSEAILIAHRREQFRQASQILGGLGACLVVVTAYTVLYSVYCTEWGRVLQYMSCQTPPLFP